MTPNDVAERVAHGILMELYGDRDRLHHRSVASPSILGSGVFAPSLVADSSSISPGATSCDATDHSIFNDYVTCALLGLVSCGRQGTNHMPDDSLFETSDPGEHTCSLATPWAEGSGFREDAKLHCST